MFPPAYTLTVLIVTLLQFSFDKQYRPVCGHQATTSAEACAKNRSRKEIRQLSRTDIHTFINVYNDYLDSNSTEEWSLNVNELGVVQIFDELLEGTSILTPYWDYRLELKLEDPTKSALWTDTLLNSGRQAEDEEWLAEVISNDVQEENDDFFEDDPRALLWKDRVKAVRAMRAAKGNNVFWHLLLLVAIESGRDQEEGPFNATDCAQSLLMYWNATQKQCMPQMGKDANCTSSMQCYNMPCTLGLCMKVELSTTTTTSPSTTLAMSTEVITSTHIPTTVLTTSMAPAQKHIEIVPMNYPMWMSTEFLAKELDPYQIVGLNDQVTDKTTIPKTPQRKNKKLRKKHKKHDKTTPAPSVREQIPPATTAQVPTVAANFATSTVNDTNAPIEPEKYNADTLDALLVYMPTPKSPAGMISWSSRMPFRMAYFSFTIIEGGLGKNRRLKEKGAKRAKGARIYVKGLDMPSGYRQVTQGKQLKTGIGALARTLHPDNNGPFVELKMRVENRYGVPCKQMCLDSHQRYRRCARRTIRLSPYRRFGDPIPYYETEQRAMDGQWTGKGYYRKRKLSHILFKCD